MKRAKDVLDTIRDGRVLGVRDASKPSNYLRLGDGPGEWRSWSWDKQTAGALSSKVVGR